MNDSLANPTLDAARHQEPLDFESPHRFLTEGPDEIAYWKSGSGPDLVLVHGWPLHAATWRDVVPALAQHFTCHLIDLPGAGQTRSRRPTPLSIADHVRTLLAVIDELELDRFAFVGHDSGAAIARLAAAKLGDRVWASVMGNTEIPGHRPWLVVALGLSLKLFGARAFTQMLASPRLLRSTLGFGACFQDTRFIDGSFHDHFVAPLIASPERTKGQLRLLAGFDWKDLDDLDEVHQRMTGPVQLIWGEHDPYFPLAKARAMKFAGGSELHVIARTKLFAHEEAHEQFVAHALRFLRQHAPSR